MKHTPPLALVLAFLVGSSDAFAGAYTYTTIDVPGQSGTVVTGISDDGTVTGYSFDTFTVSHGFNWKGGVFTFFGAPAGTENSSPVSIDDRNTVVGRFLQSNGVIRSFKRKSSGAEQKLPLQLPATANEYATGIINNNTIIGYYTLPVGAGMQYYAFSYNHGVTTTLLPPTANSSFAYGINNSGQVVGNYSVLDDYYTHAFLYSGAVYTPIDPPGSVGTYAYGITESGEAYGSFKTNPSSYTMTGFILQDGKFEDYTYPDPATTSTMITQALSKKEFVGTWLSGVFNHNAFHYLDGKYYTIVPTGASVGGVYLTSINRTGWLAGTYFVGNSTHSYGFVGTCPSGESPCTK